MARNKRPKRYTGRLSLPVRPKMLELIDAVAEELDVSRTEAARQLIVEGLKSRCTPSDAS